MAKLDEFTVPLTVQMCVTPSPPPEYPRFKLGDVTVSTTYGDRIIYIGRGEPQNAWAESIVAKMGHPTGLIDIYRSIVLEHPIMAAAEIEKELNARINALVRDLVHAPR